MPLWRVSLSFGRLSVSLSGGLEIGVSILHAWIESYGVRVAQICAVWPPAAKHYPCHNAWI